MTNHYLLFLGLIIFFTMSCKDEECFEPSAHVNYTSEDVDISIRVSYSLYDNSGSAYVDLNSLVDNSELFLRPFDSLKLNNTYFDEEAYTNSCDAETVFYTTSFEDNLAPEVISWIPRDDSRADIILPTLGELKPLEEVQGAFVLNRYFWGGDSLSLGESIRIKIEVPFVDTSGNTKYSKFTLSEYTDGAESVYIPYHIRDSLAGKEGTVDVERSKSLENIALGIYHVPVSLIASKRRYNQPIYFQE